MENWEDWKTGRLWIKNELTRVIWMIGMITTFRTCATGVRELKTNCLRFTLCFQKYVKFSDLMSHLKLQTL